MAILDVNDHAMNGLQNAAGSSRDCTGYKKGADDDGRYLCSLNFLLRIDHIGPYWQLKLLSMISRDK